MHSFKTGSLCVTNDGIAAPSTTLTYGYLTPMNCRPLFSDVPL